MSQYDILQQRATYKFRTPANGGIVFEISDYVDDYGTFQTKSQAQTFARTFQRFAKLWLEHKGYSPVSFRIVEKWNTGYGYADPQGELRKQIWNDFLSPENFGKATMQEWKGLVEKSQRPFIDYGCKG